MQTGLKRHIAWLAIGLGSLLVAKPTRRTCIADVVADLEPQLGSRRQQALLSSVESVFEDLSIGLRNMQDADRLLRSVVAAGFTHSLDGIDVLMAGRHPEGEAAGLAARMIGIPPDAWGDRSTSPTHALLLELLATSVRRARDQLWLIRISAGWESRWLEDDEQEAEIIWRHADDDDAGIWPFETEILQDAQANHCEIERRLREKLREARSERAEMDARIGGREGFLRKMGVGDRGIAQIEIRDRLQDLLKRRPLAERLDRLMMPEVDEIFLMALTKAFEDSGGNAKATLAECLARGIRRRQTIIARIEALGNAARYASFLAASPLAVADFTAAEAEVERVAVLAQRAEAAGSPFTEPQPARSGRYGQPWPFGSHLAEHHQLEEAMISRLPWRIARARSELARRMVKARRQDLEQKVAGFEQAVVLWRQAQDCWDRRAHPRKWAALEHNIARVQIALADHFDAAALRSRAEASAEAAVAALDPEREPWCWAATLAPLLGLRSSASRPTSPVSPASD